MIDYSILKDKTVLVIGAGGLGGYVISELARIGIKKLIIMDGDSFNESNMNRQLLAGYNTIGKNKAEVYAKFLADYLNISAIAYNQFFSRDNANIIDEADIVLDCLDTIECRKVLVDECSKRNKTLVHGAIDEEQGQVLICRPNDQHIDKLFKDAKDFKSHVTVSFAVATVASVQVSVACKVLSNNADELINKLIIIDLETSSMMTLKI